MRREYRIGALVLAAVLLAASGSVQAEDIKGKFYIGGEFGVFVNTDDVRSNAALIISPLGDDGAPFTGDTGEIVACDSTNATVYCDPRPDDLIARETQLEDTFELKATIGYGLTSWFSLQLDVGWFEGDVQNFDIFTTKRVPEGGSATDPCVQAGLEPCDLFFLRDKTLKQPITAANVTLNPIELNGIFRFRKDSNFNPYVGLGVGYLVTDIEQDQAVEDLNDRLESLSIIAITDEFGRNFGNILSTNSSGDPAIFADGNAPFNLPAEVDIEDGIQVQFLGGGEYFFNDRFSLIFDARYVLADHEISILMGGEDQINIETFPEDMFRSDGSVRVYNKGPVAPNPFDPNNPGARLTCDVNGDGNPDIGQDYNNDGRIDACFNPGPGTFGSPGETIVVQGGTIKLNHFSFLVGARFTF